MPFVSLYCVDFVKSIHKITLITPRLKKKRKPIEMDKGKDYFFMFYLNNFEKGRVKHSIYVSHEKRGEIQKKNANPPVLSHKWLY